MSRQFIGSFVLLALIGSLCLLSQQATAFSLSMSSEAKVGAGKTAVIAGATGYIGKSVVRESVRQGYKTIALVRDKEKVNNKQGKALFGQFFEGAEVVECDVTNPEQLTKVRTKNSTNQQCRKQRVHSNQMHSHISAIRYVVLGHIFMIRTVVKMGNIAN